MFRRIKGKSDNNDNRLIQTQLSTITYNKYDKQRMEEN